LAIEPLLVEEPKNTNIFELLPGKLLDLELNHPVKVRIKLPLIGYSIGKYIIVKYPSEQKVGNFNDVLIEGNVVISRYLLEGDRGECFAFRSTINYITQFPEKLLILSYPKKIESRQLRLHQRITTKLPASIMLINESVGHEDVKINGIINDISTKGCGFTFKSESANVTVNKRDIFIGVSVNDGEDVKIPARVCNSRNENGIVSVGVQFDDGDQQVINLLDRLFIDTNTI